MRPVGGEIKKGRGERKSKKSRKVKGGRVRRTLTLFSGGKQLVSFSSVSNLLIIFFN